MQASFLGGGKLQIDYKEQYNYIDGINKKFISRSRSYTLNYWYDNILILYWRNVAPSMYQFSGLWCRLGGKEPWMRTNLLCSKQTTKGTIQPRSIGKTKPECELLLSRSLSLGPKAFPNLFFCSRCWAVLPKMIRSVQSCLRLFLMFNQ